MPLRDINEDSWLEAFQICRDSVLAGRSTRDLIPDVAVARSYFLTDGTVIVSLKAVAKLAHRIARQSFSDNEPRDTQSKAIYDYLLHKDFLRFSGILQKHDDRLKEGLTDDDFGTGWDTPEGGYSFGSTKNRKNQSAFKMLILQTQKTCVVSGCDAMFLLHACHIDAYSDTQDHAADNGLLLRVDLHCLFDLGKLAFSSESQTWLFSDDVRKFYDDFHNTPSRYQIASKTAHRLLRHYNNSQLNV